MPVGSRSSVNPISIFLDDDRRTCEVVIFMPLMVNGRNYPASVQLRLRFVDPGYGPS